MIYFLVGLFCLLLVIGALMGKKPLEFAVKSGVTLIAVIFVAVILYLGYLLLAYH